MTSQWASDLEAKHGMPLNQIAGKVYALHYEVPQVVKSVSNDYAGPAPQSDADGYRHRTSALSRHEWYSNAPVTVRHLFSHFKGKPGAMAENLREATGSWISLGEIGCSCVTADSIRAITRNALRVSAECSIGTRPKRR
jgi:hypothetical protein